MNRKKDRMIARVWSAHTTPRQARAYADHLKRRVVPIVSTVDGYEGIMLLQREMADEIEVTVITMWRSLESIRGFAGSDIEAAVVTDEAAALFTRFDRRVRHHELVLADGILRSSEFW